MGRSREDDDEYDDEDDCGERTLQVHPKTLQVITSWEIFWHWHLSQIRRRWEAVLQNVSELSGRNVMSVQTTQQDPTRFDYAKGAL
jgi:hypothetical protein